MSLSKGLEIGKRAIMLQSEAIMLTGQNISSVDVPGYSRQRIEVKSILNGGDEKITVLDASRVRDQFIDKNIRNVNQDVGKWEMDSTFFKQIEDVFLEPSDYGLNNVLSEFWNSWEDLANNPENIAPRSVVIQYGEIVVQSINRLDSELKNLRDVADEYVDDKVDQINNIATQIAILNGQIIEAEVSGKQAGELRDSRDLLLDNISKIVNITTLNRESGSVALLIGGRTLLDDTALNTIKAKPLPSGNMTVNDVVWTDDEARVNISGGQMRGIIDIRDEIIPDILAQVDQLSATLIDEVNAIHSTGYGMEGSTGVNFFTGTNALDISVNVDIQNDVNLVAASGNGELGDNSIALAIAGLSEEKVAPGNIDMGSFYSEIVDTLGAESQQASMMLENAEMLLKNMENQRDSVSSVSLDEEAANLIRFQRAYEAAAQYMSVVNDLMDILMQIA